MDQKVFDAVLADVAAGEATYKALPAHGTDFKNFYAYLNSDEELGKKYARAKLAGLERMADEILEISDAREDDEAVQRARLRVDSRKWLLSKLAPRKYGEKLNVSGADGEGPVELIVTWRDK